MKKLLLTAALAAALSTPAFADDTAIIMWTDGTDAVTATGTGSVDLGPQNLDGVGVTLTFGNKGTNPNELNEANIQITNNDTTAQTLRIILGANGYAGPSDAFKLSGAINLDSGGAELIGQYYVDGLNGLNGTGTGVTGLEVGTFDTGALTGNEAFSFNSFGFDNVLGPYSMTEGLTPNAAARRVCRRSGASPSRPVAGVPEPSTWALMGVGFALFALGLRKKHALRGLPYDEQSFGEQAVGLSSGVVRNDKGASDCRKLLLRLVDLLVRSPRSIERQQAACSVAITEARRRRRYLRRAVEDTTWKPWRVGVA